METIEDMLRDWFAGGSDESNGITVVAALGNEMRSDQAAAIYVVRRLSELSKRGMFHPGITLAICGERLDFFLERFVGEKPDRLLFLTSADFGGEPGEVRLISRDEAGRVVFPSCGDPLVTIMDDLRESCPEMALVILGIQPLSSSIGSEMSYEVIASSDEIYEVLVRLFFRE